MEEATEHKRNVSDVSKVHPEIGEDAVQLPTRRDRHEGEKEPVDYVSPSEPEAENTEQEPSQTKGGPFSHLTQHHLVWSTELFRGKHFTFILHSLIRLCWMMDETFIFKQNCHRLCQR